MSLLKNKRRISLRQLKYGNSETRVAVTILLFVICSWSDPIPCRYVANGTGQQIKLDDGTFYTFSYVVYLDPDDRIYRHGDMVRLYDKAGNLQSEQPITRPHKGQLDTKLWL